MKKLIGIYNKIAKKEINFKKSYLTFVVLVTVLSVALSYSYALFTSSKMKEGVLNIETSNLRYALSSTSLDRETSKLILEANEKRYERIIITNTNSIDTAYSLVYKLIDALPNEVSVSYYEGTKDMPSSNLINKYGDDGNIKEVVLYLVNNTDSKKVVELFCIGGFTNKPIIIKDDYLEITNSVGASGKIDSVIKDTEINDYRFSDVDSSSYLVSSNPNNYLWYSGKLWRIISVENNGLKLVSNDIISSLYYSSGNSNYANSYIRNWLNRDFYNTLKNPNDFLIDGRFDANITNNDEKSNGDNFVTSKVGLVSRYEYSLLNYLGIGKFFWLSSPSSDTQATYVNNNNAVASASPILGVGVRPVITISNNINIVDGSGSTSNPYRIENDYDNDVSNTKLNTRYSGEYVKFNDLMYRIVSIKDNITKIVSVNTISIKLKFDDETNIYSDETIIGDYLNNTWYQSLTNRSKNMITETNFASGSVNTGANYIDASNNIVNYKIASPSVGEMFTGFVGTDNQSYLTITPNGENKITRVNLTSMLTSDTVDSMEYQLKPSFSLKENVVIVSGDGTILNPFVLEEKINEIKEPTALSNVILDETRIGSGAILIENNKTYVTGSDPNNYLWYSGNLWRIVAIEGDNIKLVTDDIITILPSYSVANNSSFATSYAYNWLNNVFYNKLRNKDILVTFGFNATLTDNNNEPENVTIVNTKVGLLSRYEYTKSHNGIASKASYLNNKSSYMLINPYNATDINYVTSDGIVGNTRTTSSLGIKPMIILNKDTEVVSGAGNSINPYRISIDNDDANSIKNTRLNTRFSGEYVTFNDALYRIVNINNTTKLVSVEMISNNKYLFSTDESWINSFSTNYSGHYLNETWFNSLNEQYRNLIVESPWTVSNITLTDNYECALTNCEDKNVLIHNSKVGMPIIGEMYSSYIGEITSLGTSFWTLSGSDENSTLVINKNGTITKTSNTNKLGIRASINLSDTTMIYDGLGTKESPFVIIK